DLPMEGVRRKDEPPLPGCHFSCHSAQLTVKAGRGGQGLDLPCRLTGMTALRALLMLPLLAVAIDASDRGHATALFSLSEVRLLDSPFREGQQLNVEHLLAYDPDRLLAPFRREAGLDPCAPVYPNWESSGLDGHTAGHYLTALAQTVATGDSPEAH